jgi:hypothetical protein
MIRTTPQARQSPQSETDGGHKGRLYLWELSTDDGAEGACEGRRLYRVVLRRRESAFALQANEFTYWRAYTSKRYSGGRFGGRESHVYLTGIRT